MAIKNITSKNPIKKQIVKTFKEMYSATKVTNLKFDTKLNQYTANCFQKFSFLGNKIVKGDINEHN